MRLHEDLLTIAPIQTTVHDPTRSSDKRSSSVLEAETGRVVKRRASRACQSCRTRKVRCDVTATDSQCTNCKLDNIECVVLASKRGRANRTDGNSVIGNAESASPQLRSNLGGIGTEAEENGVDARSSPLSPDFSGQVPVSVNFDEDLDKERRDQQPAGSDANEDRIDRLVLEAPGGVIASEPETEVVASPSMRASLPSFVAKLPIRILPEDLDFLIRKGAMTIPEPELRTEILRGYLYGVHPFMPMLDFKNFSQAVLSNKEGANVSLLLFQAVMFAGLHPLKLDVIKRLGFESVKQAREVFFNRVRLLYEFDVERDSIAILQSLILMSSWYGKWDERKHTWHWTGLAYDVARNIGLHREPTTKFGSERIRHFRRRLWWSLYIRDRLIALGTRRPMRIQDDDFDVAMLTLEDFDIEEMAEPVRTQSISLGVEENTSIALMCIQLAGLCKLIGHVVSSQYTVLNSHPDVPYTMMVVSKRNMENTQELERCDRELEEWYRTLGGSSQRSDSLTAPKDPNSCSGVHWTILNIIYLTVLNVLHRAQALQPLPESPDARIIQISSRSKVKRTARSLTKSLRTMLSLDQVRFLGPVGVTALVAASLSHTLDINAEDVDVRDACAFRLSQSLQVLQALREMYASADAGISFLATITQRADGVFPAPAPDPTTSNRVSTSSGVSRQTSIDQQDQRPKTLEANLQVKPFNKPAEGMNQNANSQRVLLKNGQLAISSSMAGPSSIQPPAEAFTASNNPTMYGYESIDIARDDLISELYSNQGIDAAFGGLSSSATHGAFLDWNYDAHADIDLGSMAFNYDFDTDTF